MKIIANFEAILIRPDLQRIMGTEEATARAIVELLEMDKHKKKILTDLDFNEVNVLTLLTLVGERLKIKEFTKFAENFAEYRVSMGRLGRKELTGIITMAGFQTEERGRMKSLKSVFTGFK